MIYLWTDSSFFVSQTNCNVVEIGEKKYKLIENAENHQMASAIP